MTDSTRREHPIKKEKVPRGGGTYKGDFCQHLQSQQDKKGTLVAVGEGRPEYRLLNGS